MQVALFPGQGSQHQGMLENFISEYALVKNIFNQASEVLDQDLLHIISQDPDLLNQTATTQPILLASSYALWSLLQDRCDFKPQFVAGHSLGEYSALVCAGALDFADGLKLVQRRGQLMQAAVTENPGAMAAVLGLSDQSVVELCQSIDYQISPANFNCPGQVVIAGEEAGIDAAIAAAKDFGAKRILKLPVSVPSHCALMKQAAVEFAKVLDAVPMRMPSIGLIHNVSAAPSQSVAELKAALVAQLDQPVLWTQTLAYLQQQGVNNFFECGPKNVLSNLVKRMVDKDQCAIWSLSDPEAFGAVVARCQVQES